MHAKLSEESVLGLEIGIDYFWRWAVSIEYLTRMWSYFAGVTATRWVQTGAESIIANVLYTNLQMPQLAHLVKR